jgi:hypothetical protein
MIAQSPGRDSNVRPEYEAGLLTTRPRHSVPSETSEVVCILVCYTRNFQTIFIPCPEAVRKEGACIQCE